MAFSRDHTLLTDATKRGATLSADAQLLCDSAAAAAQFRRQALDILGTGLPLNAAVRPAGVDTCGLVRVCELLRQAAGDANCSAANIGLVVAAGCLPVAAAWQLRREVLGDGPLFVLTDVHTGDADWEQLWTLRGGGHVRVACAGVVTSSCRLLGAEAATNVTPGTCIQSPSGSAWVSRNICLAACADEHGLLERATLATALRRAVETADDEHAAAVWPTARMRHDAWLNRRLGIEVRGIGELVRRRGLDPASFAALQDMADVMRDTLELIRGCSRQLAALSGRVPVLDQAGHDRLFSDPGLRDGWRRRWRQAVDAAALRHRNLLVLSPWALFPALGQADYCHANLVPLLRFADACAFPEPPDLSAWNSSEFRGFYRRTTAVLQQRSALGQIAEPA